MADINRRKILTLLKDKELSVNDLLKNFKITQATLSNHLSILRKTNLVENRILGKQRIYRLNMDVLRLFTKNIEEFGGMLEKNGIREMEIRIKK